MRRLAKKGPLYYQAWKEFSPLHAHANMHSLLIHPINVAAASL